MSDFPLLSQVAKAAKEALPVDEIDVVADIGYYQGQQVKECSGEGITPYIPKANTSASRQRGLSTKQDFRYDPDQDSYRCPSGEVLTYRFTTVEQEREIRYYANPATCRSCPLKAQCTRNKAGRRITRWVDEHLLEAMEARVRAEPDKVGLRKLLAEHRSSSLTGPLRDHQTVDEPGLFPLTRPKKVRAEMALTVITYNIKRVIRIVGVPRMIQALA